MRRVSYRSVGAHITPWLLPTVVLIIAIGMAWIEPRFYNRLNLMNIARNFAVAGVLGMAQALVMIVGGFDLSVGAIMALASVLGASTMVAVAALVPDYAWLSIAAGSLVALLGGGLVGSVSGTLIATMRLSPFIVTLAVASSLLGAVFFVTKGVPVYGIPDLFTSTIGRGQIFGLPTLFCIVLVVAALLTMVTNLMAVGRHVYAVGGALKAAYASGIAAGRLYVLIYALAGSLASLAGLMVTARIGSGQSNIGTSAAIESISAAVVAGVSLRGGKGSIPRVLLAALLLTVIGNSLNLLQISSKFQTMVLGIFLLGTIATERLLGGSDDD